MRTLTVTSPQVNGKLSYSTTFKWVSTGPYQATRHADLSQALAQHAQKKLKPGKRMSPTSQKETYKISSQSDHCLAKRSPDPTAGK